MQSQRPTFSIVVPIYNEERFIREALNSILAQTDPDWEALLVDDGSTDSTPGILDAFAEKDGRFRVFHKSNGGQSTAINKGVEEARGEWICWLSGDDYFHPKKLELNKKWIRDYPDTKFLFTGFWLVEQDGSITKYNLDWLNIENSAYHLISLFRCNYVMGISVCIKREAWLKNRGFDENLRYAHDLDMWLRLMLNTPSRYFPERTCTMRSHPGQESAKFPLAGLFDSAKSAIRVINNHAFVDYFPGMDLTDRQIAMEMLSRSLDFVACAPDANFYSLGIHPLLQLRIMEWLWDPAIDPVLAEDLQNIYRRRVSEMVAIHTTSPFGLLWKAVHAAIELAHPNFVYFPCDPGKVGELNYYFQNAVYAEMAKSLRTYLELYDGLHLEDAKFDFCAGRQIVLLLPPEVSLDDPSQPIFIILLDICHYLIQTGCLIILVGKSNHTLGLVDGLLYLGVENESDQKKLITALGNLDTLVAFTHPERLKWSKAECGISLKITVGETSGLNIATILLKKMQSVPIQKNFIVESKFFIIRLWVKVRQKIRFL